MPFDDEDLIPASLNPTSDEAPFDPEDGDQAQDFRLFTSLLTGPGKKTQASSKAIRRGEKDFESHGTRAQENVLESSRSAMHEVLGYTRQHQPRNVVRGWYFPDRWADTPMESEPTSDATADKQSGDRTTTKARGSSQGLFASERVVALESDRSTMLTSMGRVVTSAEKSSPGWLKTWLLPEEALFLVERGTLDLWWPARGIEEIFPIDEDLEDKGKLEDYELGVPLSLQAAYALFIGRDGERGKISLERYQVYANLRRTGYRVLRAASILPKSPPSRTSESLWQWLFSLLKKTNNLLALQSSYPGYGPLVRPGLYRSYVPIFEQLALVQRHKPSPLPTSESPDPQDPFKIHFLIWKSNSNFMKTKPPPPDFQMAVVDARDSSVPTLEQLDTLLLSTPWDPPEDEGKIGAGFVYKRLKHGWRNAIMAIVDRGLISYMRFGEMAFGEELLYQNTNLLDITGKASKQ
ncbi:hypothetical protein ONZ43_g5337 [Nemania bipapillata]|uniref:Uncharacterized protein n=1 Tax=Nemania bipapillata TaxID=110536 RepID=A0ACC2IC20_9PEZI|nr:hypothetical protein ONZ43_g5337 [Nemania bipapillata]